MRRADFTTEADYYRAHAGVFRFALELKCTPAEAELELRRREAIACRERLDAKLNAPIEPGMPELAERAARHGEEPQLQWWQRD